MRVQPTPPAIWRESLKASVDGIAALGKSSNSAGPGDERHDETPRGGKARAPLRVELVCQDGTKPHDPFRDAPRLSSAFVSQLLGQVMAHAERPLPRNAYGAVLASTAPLFDTRL